MNESTEIWREKFQIDKARRQKMHDAMEEYDQTIYYPAMKLLQERCAAIGHKKGVFHDNGLGWSWWYCNQCGSRMDIERHAVSASESEL